MRVDWSLNYSLSLSSAHLSSERNAGSWSELYPIAHAQLATMEEDSALTYQQFERCIREIAGISDRIQDGWQFHQKQGVENGSYITKQCSQLLEKSHHDDETVKQQLLVIFEYHIAYNINYTVPVLCFIAWKQDGSLLDMDEYSDYNTKFPKDNILSTLTQLDHPVLCKPFLTLHPCRTGEILQTFSTTSKNPVISWLSVISPYLNMKLEEDYVTHLLK